MKAIVNRKGNFGSVNGVIRENTFIQSQINKALKEGRAKRVIDTEDILMYEINGPYTF